MDKDGTSKQNKQNHLISFHMWSYVHVFPDGEGAFNGCDTISHHVRGMLHGKAFHPSKEMRILMVGLDAAGKTTILYKLKLGVGSSGRVRSAFMIYISITSLRLNTINIQKLPWSLVIFVGSFLLNCQHVTRYNHFWIFWFKPFWALDSQQVDLVCRFVDCPSCCPPKKNWPWSSSCVRKIWWKSLTSGFPDRSSRSQGSFSQIKLTKSTAMPHCWMLVTKNATPRTTASIGWKRTSSLLAKECPRHRRTRLAQNCTVEQRVFIPKKVIGGSRCNKKLSISLPNRRTRMFQTRVLD